MTLPAAEVHSGPPPPARTAMPLASSVGGCLLRGLMIVVMIAAAQPLRAADGRPMATNLDDRVVLAPLPRQPFDLAGVASIHLARDATAAEKAAASVLARALSQRFARALAVRDTLAVGDGAAIVLGRAFASTSDFVSAREFAALPFEGFVIKAGGNRAVITGADPAGTVFGIFAFLRRAGWQSVPGPAGGHIEGWSGASVDRLGPLATAARPHFERRDGGRLTDGRYGETLRQFALANLNFTQDDPLINKGKYLHWDHTAGYLLPLALFRDSHPEFFSRLPSGETIPLDTPANRVMICPCSDAAVRISSQRVNAWIERQPDARWFAVTDGDSHGNCPQCSASDPSPDSSTDRLIRWLDGVATISGRSHPDKTFYTFAYQQSVAPPLNVTSLAANALVMYAPWLWTSRATSAVPFQHPLNVIAEEELTGWLQAFPGRIGVYDYADDTPFGFTAKIKSLAKQGVRWHYINALSDPFTDFMTTRLRFDPFAESADLQAEFISLYYGPAASVVTEYFRIKEAVIAERSRVSLNLFEDPVFRERLPAFVDRLAAAADRAQGTQKLAMLQGAVDVQAVRLRATSAAARDPESFRIDLDRYLTLGRGYLDAARQTGVAEGDLTRLWRDLRRTLVRLGATVASESGPSVDDRIGVLKPAAEALVAAARRQAAQMPALAAEQPIQLSFATEPGDTKGWRTATSMAATAPPAVVRDYTDVTGTPRPAVVISAPLSDLPEIRRGGRSMHGGRFSAERTFSRPIDLGQRRYVDLHVASSSAVPVTVYLSSEFPVKSSVMLAPGEQILRIDLAAMSGRDPQYPDLPPRSGQLRRIALDIWPQDILFPHPPAKDVQIVLLGLSASHEMPVPERLPYAGRVVWLTQFRANVGFGNVLADVNTQLAALGPRPAGAVGLLSTALEPAQSEAFRSYTEHRLLSPLAAIRVGDGADGGEREAAMALQRRLEAMFGVNLPIDPAGASPIAADSGNIVLVGRAASRAAGIVSETDLSFVGEEGFVIRARSGRVALAGAGSAGAMPAIARYLEDHGARFAVPERREALPDRRSGFLHELVVLDWPFFRDRRVPCGALLGAAEPASRGDRPIGDGERAAAQAAGEAIKAAARRGGVSIAGAHLAAVSSSPLACYVGAKLLWDPFLDTSRLIQEFQQAGGHGRPQ
ncbi:MAG: DUF4838 domain-containing protein [Rhodospirillales bacterium]|nr:DUF4838 domain-containing protein [Rhodospirillales bacterium]